MGSGGEEREEREETSKQTNTQRSTRSETNAITITRPSQLYHERRPHRSSLGDG
jgi:hypothetical protein